MAYQNLFGDNFLPHLLDIAEAVEKSRAKRMASGKDTSAVFNTANRFDLTKVTEYFRAIKQFKKTNRIEVGAFYTYTYRFDKKGVNPKHLRFYDFQPLVLVFAQFESKAGDKLHCGINFHRLPIVIRQKLVNALFKKHHINPQFSRATDRLVGVNFKSMVPIVKKLGFAVRNYRQDRIVPSSLKKIPLSYVRQLIIFYPETLYKAPIGELLSKYTAWRVGKPIAS